MRLVAVLFLAIWAGCCNAVKFPIVIVPGICGSQIEAKHYKDLHYPFYCPSMKDWTQVWLSLEEVFPKLANCFAKDMTLEFDPKTKKYSEPDGVGVRIPNFGSTKSVEYLDQDTSLPVRYTTRYFHDMVDFFVKDMGYVRDETIVAAPFDWRLSPWSMDGYFENLQSLIDNVTAKYNAPAILVSHSMGGPTLQAFLNATTADWKAKAIAAWFPIEGVWTGSPKVLKAVLSGDNFGTPAPVGELVDFERTLESTIFLMPHPALWPKNNSDLVYLQNPQKVYGVNDYLELFTALNVSYPEERINHILEKRLSLQAPGVRVFCIYGTGMDTAYGYEYADLRGSNPLRKILGDGDGTVPLPSLEYCKNWKSQQTQPVELQSFPGVEHVKAIMDPDIFRYVQKNIDAMAEEYDRHH